MSGGALVVDSSALLAALFAEPDARRYAEALQAAASLRISAPNWLEAMLVAAARSGNVGREGLRDLVDRLYVEIVVCDETLAHWRLGCATAKAATLRA